MRRDEVTRVLLSALLVSAVLLLVQGCDRGSAVSQPAAISVPRFEIRPVAMRRGPPLLVRLDTATGQAWSMGLMDKSEWEPLAEDADGVPVPDGDVPGRFSIRAHTQSRGLPTLVRLDSETGRIWRKPSRSPRPWVPVPNPAPDAEPADPSGADAADDTGTDGV